MTRPELLMAPKTFDFQHRRQAAEVLAECRRQGVSVVSVHGNLQRKYNDPVEDRRRAATAALLDELRLSEEAGAEILVAHFGTTCKPERPPRNYWIKPGICAFG